MQRETTPQQQAEIEAFRNAPVFFWEFVFDDETVRLWSESGIIRWNGHDWIGAGTDLGMSRVEENNEVQATGLTVSLSGVLPETVALALQKNCIGRPVTVWLGMWRDGGVVPEPSVLFAGRMDQMPIREGGDTSTVSVVCENRLADLRRPRVWYYDDETQKLDHPGDRFFEYVASLAEKQIVWGRA